jgi:response regulator RpfG family c-di-GMP phosphodiesterase
MTMDDPKNPMPASPDAGQRRPRLLLVDDQPVNIQALYEIFAADHEVFMATSGERALEFCLETPPDLILLDLVMVGMDGLEVCRRLKAARETRHIVVIFVTAHGGSESEAMGLDAGAVDFIYKPANPRIVRARVRTHLALKFQSELLEATIAQRTADLREKLSLIEQQQETLVLLSTPVLRIWDGVLVLPIIGVIDARRAEQIMDTALSAIVEQRAQILIMDITGTTVVDAEVSEYLIRTARAAGLLGVQCMLVGISPRIALALVQSGADLGKVTTFGALQDGLEEALRRMRYIVTRPMRSG